MWNISAVLGGMIKNHARCTSEIKSRIGKAKLHSRRRRRRRRRKRRKRKRRRRLFTSKLRVKFNEETSKVLHFEHRFLRYYDLLGNLGK